MHIPFSNYMIAILFPAEHVRARNPKTTVAFVLFVRGLPYDWVGWGDASCHEKWNMLSIGVG